MRQLGAVIRILPGCVNHLRYQLPMRNAVAPQFIGYDLSRFSTVALDYPLEETLCRLPIPASLEININYFAILIHSAPQIVLLTLNLHEDFVDVESVSVALVSTFQPSGISGAELDAPKAN